MSLIKSAEFICSNTDVNKCPVANLPEYAFIGRSNVGKSSLLNMITGVKELAKTSSKPGKTQLINHFVINKLTNPWYLVDLPGYGYAKVSKEKKYQWQQFISKYLTSRTNLVCVFVLIDSRLEPQGIDLDFISWLGQNNLPFTLVFTKTDKLSAKQIEDNINKFCKTLLTEWEELPLFFKSSSIKKTGKEEIVNYINEQNNIVGNIIKENSRNLPKK
jgi:GTP-binding protein